jgi:hypothetical protein
MYKHGLTRTPEWNSWVAMRQRCLDRKQANWKFYGGRGVTVSDEWRESFEKFLEDMGKMPRRGMSIDRIDNTKGYCKENCRWATRKQQHNNTSRTIYLEYKGVVKTMMDWAEKLGVPYGRLKARRKRGLSDMEIILGTCKNKRFITHEGETHCLNEWARKTGIESATISMRIKRGWGIKRALEL